MISISTIENTTDGEVDFDELPTSIFRATPVRVVKSQTLDGDVVIDHRGFVTGDQEFTIRAELDEATENKLWAIYKANTFIYLSCKEGFFKGVIADMKCQNGDLTLKFYVKE